MPKVTILKGLPGSGKSQFARKQVNNKLGVKRINKDDLRAMLDDGVYHWQNEKFVLQVRDALITQAIAAGYDVIVDDTNLNPKMERGIRVLVGPTIPVEVMFFDVDVEECIKRDAARQGTAHVGEEVIRRMAKQWQGWKDEDCSVTYNYNGALYVPDPTLPSCILVDIDGTLATHGDERGHFDWHLVGKDQVVPVVAELVRRYYHDLGYAVIIFSGRDAICREDTVQWLIDNEIPYNDLYMREVGNSEKDSVIKSRLFDNHVSGKYNVQFVLDDRKQVKQMWVKRGLFVLDCNQHDEIF